MFGWGAGARRVEAVERELAGLLAKLTEASADAALETERAKAATRIGALGDRLLDLQQAAVAQAERFAAIEAVLAGLSQRLAAIEERLPEVDEQAEAARRETDGQARKRQQDEFAFLRSSLLALDREVRRYANEAEKADHALYEQIAQVRAPERRDAQA